MAERPLDAVRADDLAEQGIGGSGGRALQTREIVAPHHGFTPCARVQDDSVPASSQPAAG
jgi:hypothetical protein